MDIFSERFKALKEARHFTYDDIAKHLALKPRTIKFYASGDVKPDYFGLLALADLFDVSLDYLTGRSDDPARR